jgi:hypothetical protein
MSNDLLASVCAAVLVLALVAARYGRGERHRIALATALCCVAAAVPITAFAAPWAWVPEEEVLGRPIEMPGDGYVTSRACRACHPREYATWRASYHSTMTQRASPTSVLGDFDGVTLELSGKTFRLDRDGGGFWIELDDPMAAPGSQAARVRREVTMTTGSHHMQLCWYESGHSRVTALLPFVWLVDERQWIPRRAAFVIPPTDVVEPEFGQWSIVCLKCHATHGRPRADMDTSGLHGADTHVAEFGIACEACHGPGAAHVASNRNPARRYAQHASGEPDPTVVNPKHLPHRASTQVCGQCHGNFDYLLEGDRLQRWFAEGFAYRPGHDLERTRTVNRHGRDEQFWSDGVPRVAGREYNALVGSGCYQRGELSCLSCHVLHQPADDPRPRREWANDQLRRVDEDRTCLQCHPSFAADVAAHTHHAPGSGGSRCYDCHMPHTAYALLKGVRNHRIASPSVANELATGRPNACSQCHLDKTLQWTAEWLREWYGIDSPELAGDDTAVAAGVVWSLKGDAAQRALVAWNFGWAEARAAAGDDWMAPYLAQLLDDPYEAVRRIALRSLRQVPGNEAVELDVLAGPEVRAAAREAVLARWRQHVQPPGDDRRAAVLLAADGSLQQDRFARLLAARNHRPVQLHE